jgi:tRNA modification GTPase
MADTIAAIATPSGRGGVGIIRLSGEAVPQIAEKILGRLPSPRQASHQLFKDKDNKILDDGIALYFPAPHSFTGEHVLELQGHGGQIVMDMLLQRCVQLGARLANPGEFSERAFLNDKLDLAQAEAIADLIDSGSEQAVRSALRSLQGEFSDAINALLQKMIEIRVYVEAALDFPEEEIDFLADEHVTQRLDAIKNDLNNIKTRAAQGNLLRDGIHLVIAGKPNAGKSSLLNALAGNDAAIVTEVAGTTRDILREAINLDGMPLHIIDTAGLRDSDDPVEKIGIERAWQEIEKADLIVHLIDISDDENKADNQKILNSIKNKYISNASTLPPILTVYNKIDLTSADDTPINNKAGTNIYISAKHKQGIDTLKTKVKQYMGYQSDNEGAFIARRRHLLALDKTQHHVNQAELQLKEFNAGELMAEELRLAQDELGKITGKFTSDNLLGEIFSSFCIGK